MINVLRSTWARFFSIFILHLFRKAINKYLVVQDRNTVVQEGGEMGTPIKMTTTSLDPSYRDITCPEYLQFRRIYQLPSQNYIERRLYSADHRDLGVFNRCRGEIPSLYFYFLETQS